MATTLDCDVPTKKHDPILDAIGDKGRWQMFQFVATGLCIMPGTFAILIITFMNAKTEYWCARPDYLRQVDFPVEQWRVLSGQKLRGSSCQMWDLDYTVYYNDSGAEPRALSIDANKSYIACEKFEFDRSILKSTVVQEWNLVCSDSYKLSVGQSVYFLGMCLGVLIVGVLCDKYGRKLILMIVVLLVTVAGVLTAFMPTFESFLFLRFISSQGSIGSLVVVTAYLMEIFGGKWATVLGIAMEYFWDASWLILGICAMYITDWRSLTLALSIPGLLVIPMWWLIPESPRWLLVHGHREKAEEIVKKAAKMNNTELSKDFHLRRDDADSRPNHSHISFFDLFRHPQLRGKTLILWINFFSNALTYYGLTLNSGDLNPDLFTNFMLNGIMEIPAITIGICLIIFSGKRKVPYVVTLALSGVFLLLLAIAPKDETGLTNMILSAIGKFFVTISFAIIYPFASELFPTVLRTTGVGSGCMYSRLAGAMASWLAMLSNVNVFIPTTIFGILALVSSALAMMLPEPEVTHLPDTIEEGEKIKLIIPFWSRSSSK